MPKLMGIHCRISEEWEWEPVLKLLQWVRQRQVAACSRSVPVQRTKVHEITIHQEAELTGLGDGLDVGGMENEKSKMSPKNYVRLF